MPTLALMDDPGGRRHQGQAPDQDIVRGRVLHSNSLTRATVSVRDSVPGRGPGRYFTVNGTDAMTFSNSSCSFPAFGPVADSVIL